jgi:hypothetical protein
VTGSLQGRNRLAGQIPRGVLRQQPRSNNREQLAVRASAKEIVFGPESRAAIQAGIDNLADAVGVTLGPRGKALEFWYCSIVNFASFAVCQ